ncbi:HAD-IIB family hydrolase [Alloscardovia omnicolens]|uniref:HAD-IIB family hydrolase n=1 Tax=Alloscardovia omnicolens TaxID=419015 RepID=UPI003A78D7AB
MMPELVVEHVHDINIHEYTRHARVLAFDLDNTLARSKMPMTDETARLFASLTHLLPVAIVTGGRFELIESQVLDSTLPYMYPNNVVLLPTTGTSYFQWNGRTFAPWYTLELSDDQKNRARYVLERYARSLHLWYEHTDGVRIEDRGSQITFSALGSHAQVDRKEAWDPDGAKRSLLAAQVQKELPDLTVRVAGSTSIDISSRGIDKSFAVSKIAEQFTISPSDIVFVGDRMSPGGNDYPAALAGTQAVRVDGRYGHERVYASVYAIIYTRLII